MKAKTERNKDDDEEEKEDFRLIFFSPLSSIHIHNVLPNVLSVEFVLLDKINLHIFDAFTS